jgi:hypothetical protein
MRRIYIIIVSIVLNISFVDGQEMFGVINSTYSGINSLNINPANIADSRLYIDIQVFSGHFHAQNDFIYFDKAKHSLNSFAQNPPSSLDSIRNIFDCFDRYDKINGYINMRINGPGIMFSFGKHGIAFSNSLRFLASTRNAPTNIAKLGFFGLNNTLDFEDDWAVEKFNLAGVSFEEFNLSYTNIISNNKQNHFALGFTIKGLLGFGGVYFSNNHIDYSRQSVDSVYFNMDSEYAFALSNENTMNKMIKGSGIAIDLGVVIQKNTRNRTFQFSSLKDQKYYGYKYKLGFSILDFGFIKFTENAQYHIFENASVNYREVNAIDFSSLYLYSESLSYVFFQDSSATLNGNEFSISLPASASIQFDYYIDNDFFVNGTFIQGINVFKNQIKRPTVVAISPRWDKKNFQIHLPITIYNFRQPQVGIAINVENVTIGTDRLAFWSKKFCGMDFYISAKIPLAKNQAVSF